MESPSVKLYKFRNYKRLGIKPLTIGIWTILMKNPIILNE